MCLGYVTAQEVKARESRRTRLYAPGEEDQQKADDQSSHLYVYDTVKKQRALLFSRFNFGQAFWTPDSQQIVFINEKYADKKGTGAVCSLSRLQVQQALDEVGTGANDPQIGSDQMAHVKRREVTYKAIATLHSQDYDSFPPTPLTPTFLFLHMSRDSSCFWVQNISLTGKNPMSDMVVPTITIQVVDLKNGIVASVARFKDAIGNVDYWAAQAIRR